MHVEFTDEQNQLREVVRDFASAEIAPHAVEWDRDHTFPVDTVRAMRHNDVSFLRVPDAYYEMLPARVGAIKENVAELSELGILVDRDDVVERGLARQSEMFDRHALEEALLDSKALPRLRMTVPHSLAIPALLRDTQMLSALHGRIMEQGLVMAYADALFVFGVALLLCMGTVLLLRKPEASAAVSMAH